MRSLYVLDCVMLYADTSYLPNGSNHMSSSMLSLVTSSIMAFILVLRLSCRWSL